jgi:hypothetical protein
MRFGDSSPRVEPMARWFRPETTVDAPDGRTWEVYVSRFRGPRWRPWDYEEPPYAGNASGGWFLIDAVQFVVYAVLLPAMSLVLRLPAAFVRSRRSSTWVVEAVCWWPHEQRFQWWVDAGDRGRVTDEVAKGIAEGRWAQPAGAVFNGEVTR